MGKSILEGLSEPSNALKLQELARNLANIYPGIAGSRRIFKNRYPRERNCELQLVDIKLADSITTLVICILRTFIFVLRRTRNRKIPYTRDFAEVDQAPYCGLFA